MLTSIQKMATVLKLFRLERPELTLSEIVNETNYPKSTVYKILTTLIDSDLIAKHPFKKTYSPSILTFEMGQFYLNQLDLIREITPFTKRLVDKTKMLVLISQYKSGETIWIHETSTSPYQTLSNFSQVGKRAPALKTSSGKAILAYLNEEEVKKSFDLYKVHMHYVEEEKLDLEHEKIMLDLKKVKTLGFANESEILEKGKASIAAPLFNYSHIPFGSISIVGEASLFQPKEIILYGNLVKEIANQISHHFGYDYDMHY